MYYFCFYFWEQTRFCWDTMTTKQPLEGLCKGKLSNNNNQGNNERVCFQHGVRMLQTAAASDVSTRRKSHGAISCLWLCGHFLSCMMQTAVGGSVNEEAIHHASSLVCLALLSITYDFVTLCCFFKAWILTLSQKCWIWCMNNYNTDPQNYQQSPTFPSSAAQNHASLKPGQQEKRRVWNNCAITTLTHISQRSMRLQNGTLPLGRHQLHLSLSEVFFLMSTRC